IMHENVIHAVLCCSCASNVCLNTPYDTILYCTVLYCSDLPMRLIYFPPICIFFATAFMICPMLLVGDVCTSMRCPAILSIPTVVSALPFSFADAMYWMHSFWASK